MEQVDVLKSETTLLGLVERAAAGEEIVIAKDEVPVAKSTRANPPHLLPLLRKPPWAAGP